jgi:hypothetical protein
VATADSLRGFLRGEHPSDVLRELGFTIDGTPGNLSVDYPSPNDESICTFPIGDLARGLLVVWARGSELQEWASLVVMVDWIDIEDIDSPDGGALWEAIWSAAGGDEVTDNQLNIARRLAT